MLQRLYISNYALIDVLELSPNSGFTAITGETGAGKSIILGALGLILGNRAEGADLYDASRKCVIEGTFVSHNSSVQSFFTENDFDFDNEVMIRRELLPSGKSRAFINDTPAKLEQLKILGQKLIDIHSQHGHLDLKNESFLLEVIDHYAGIHGQTREYSELYAKYQYAYGRLKRLQAEYEKQVLDLDYNQFLYNEIDELNLKSGELDQIESELGELQHAEEIQSSLESGSVALEDDGGAILSNLLKLEGILASLSGYTKSIDELISRVKQTRIELEDVRDEISSIQSNVEHNPEKLEVFTERLNSINHLLHKHNLNSDQELLDKLAELEQKLSDNTDLEVRIKHEQEEVDALFTNLTSKAKNLSLKRKACLSSLVAEVVENLKKLGIKHASLDFDFENRESFHVNGLDSVKLLFSANAGKKVQEVSKVASGGELSRIILALKSLLAERENLPSIVFDEIDTGVSGEVGNRMGEIMKTMSRKMQVMSITHLPQVAAKGNDHYTVYKDLVDDRSITGIRKVTGEERVIELAKMLSGNQVSTQAKENARILLNN